MVEFIDLNSCISSFNRIENTESGASIPKTGTRISRLAAMAAGVDISQLQHSTSSILHPSTSTITSVNSSTTVSPPTSLDYVRRFTYPDGDTHYDWLACPLADMQANSTKSLPASSKTSTLSSFPRKSSFLVYDSSLPNSTPIASTSNAATCATISLSHSSYRRQLSTSRKMLRCEECGKYYGNEYSLHHHICLRRKDVWKKGDVPTRVVDGQVTYFCPMCSKPFKWLGNLTRHYYVHTGQRFFKCDICRKEFFSAYQVRRHMNSHTGLRFQCTVCDKPFTCKYACAWHMRQHFKESETQK